MTLLVFNSSTTSTSTLASSTFFVITSVSNYESHLFFLMGFAWLQRFYSLNSNRLLSFQIWCILCLKPFIGPLLSSKSYLKSNIPWQQNFKCSIHFLFAVAWWRPEMCCSATGDLLEVKQKLETWGSHLHYVISLFCFDSFHSYKA